MKLDITWTEQIVKDLAGSVVDSQGEICVLCWDQIDYSQRNTRVWLMSSRDGMLYLYGNSHAEAAEKLNKQEVKIYHRVEHVSITGQFL